MHELSYFGKIALVSIWFRMVLTQIVIKVHKDSLVLTYPPHIIYVTCIFILTSIGGFCDMLIGETMQSSIHMANTSENYIELDI